MRRSHRVRNVFFAVLGAVVLVLKPAYRGPFEDVVRSYVGNLSVSFALYFAAINATVGFRRPRRAAAALTLVAAGSSAPPRLEVDALRRWSSCATPAGRGS